MREKTDTVSTRADELPLANALEAAQDIVIGVSEVAGTIGHPALSPEQRDKVVAWLHPIFERWAKQHASVQPSIDPARLALLEASADELHRSFMRVMANRPLNATMSPRHRKVWDDTVEQAIDLLAGFYTTPSAVQKMERAFPLLAKLLDRLTNAKHHPGGSCSWCGGPMNQMHRIKSECPVSAAQGFQDELTASVQEP